MNYLLKITRCSLLKTNHILLQIYFFKYKYLIRKTYEYMRLGIVASWEKLFLYHFLSTVKNNRHLLLLKHRVLQTVSRFKVCQRVITFLRIFFSRTTRSRQYKQTMAKVKCLKNTLCRDLITVWVNKSLMANLRL